MTVALVPDDFRQKPRCCDRQKQVERLIEHFDKAVFEIEGFGFVMEREDIDRVDADAVCGDCGLA